MDSVQTTVLERDTTVENANLTNNLETVRDRRGTSLVETENLTIHVIRDILETVRDMTLNYWYSL